MLKYTIRPQLRRGEDDAARPSADDGAASDAGGLVQVVSANRRQAVRIDAPGHGAT
jgi:hypothetical protein